MWSKSGTEHGIVLATFDGCSGKRGLRMQPLTIDDACFGWVLLCTVQVRLGDSLRTFLPCLLFNLETYFKRCWNWERDDGAVA